MEMLPSGLPEHIVDEEELARFLMSNSPFNSLMVKPSGFLPEPVARETSVFRHGAEPREALWAIASQYAPQQCTLHGAAVFKAGDVREIGLEVIADEPPLRHAAIRNWRWTEDDPAMREAQHLEQAILLASKAELLRK